MARSFPATAAVVALCCCVALAAGRSNGLTTTDSTINGESARSESWDERHANKELKVIEAIARRKLLASGAPSDILNLRNWKLQLPTGTEQRGLTGYSSKYFYTRSGKVVLWTPANGVPIGSSDHPRTELREMTSSGDAASWSLFGSSRTMSFTGAVTQLGAGDSVVIAQVVNPSIEPLQLRVQRDSGGAARILAWTNDKSNKATKHDPIIPSYTIGKSYSVTVVAGNGQIQVKIAYNTQQQSQTYKYAKPKDGCYFKVGNYLQSDSDSEVVLSALIIQ